MSPTKDMTPSERTVTSAWEVIPAGRINPRQSELLHITTKGRPRHMHQSLLVETFPWEPTEKGNTSMSLVIDSKPAETTETANMGLAILNVLCPSQKLPVFQTQIWRGSSYLLPGMVCMPLCKDDAHPKLSPPQVFSLLLCLLPVSSLSSTS